MTKGNKKQPPATNLDHASISLPAGLLGWWRRIVDRAARRRPLGGPNFVSCWSVDVHSWKTVMIVMCWSFSPVECAWNCMDMSLRHEKHHVSLKSLKGLCLRLVLLNEVGRVVLSNLSRWLPNTKTGDLRILEDTSSLGPTVQVSLWEYSRIITEHLSDMNQLPSAERLFF